jgi:serine/threonine protein kinase
MALSVGDKLGPYEILAPIGAGGMGEVYKARDTRLNRTVAIKVSKDQFTERFEGEARVVASLNHPNICQLYDVGPNYLVMELIDGVPLKGPLPAAKAVEYAGQILDALDAAHRKGITHRDLKPVNILVTKQGIKLLDFGLAKQAAGLGSGALTVATMTIQGQIAGTLQSADFKRPNSWSPDGRYILYWSEQNNGDLMVLPLRGDRKPFPFLSTPFHEQQGVFSPDGKWVAYQSDESGRVEVYVRPFPGPGGKWQVSTEGGNSPRWRKDGKELYYLASDLKLMVVAVMAQGATFAPSTPEALFQTHIALGTNKPQYDVARDGRFLIDTELADASTEPIHLLLNWKPPAK